VKSDCKICSDCGHGNVKGSCKICSDCGHGNVKSNCIDCSGCVHKRIQRQCTVCNPCLHGQRLGNCNSRRGINCCRLSEAVGRRIRVSYQEDGELELVVYTGVIVSAEIGELKVRFDGDEDAEPHPVYVGSNKKEDQGLAIDEWLWEEKKESKQRQREGKRPAAAVPLSPVSAGAANAASSGAKRRQR